MTAYETKMATAFFTAGPRPAPIVAIVIHHWGPDGQSFDGVRDFLASATKDREVSAHKVIQGADADGTPNARVARIVNDEDIAWQAGDWPANQVTLGYECRPEASDADYEAVAAEIRADRAKYGDLPLHPHSRYAATECPGRWDLARLDRLARQESPMSMKCQSVLWRGVVVCSHSVPKLNAWAASTGSWLVRPIPGCGSRQTSTKESAGTHAGGGAIDTYAPADDTLRALYARKAREFGLLVSWGREYIAGVWSNHFHVLDPSCPELARAAVAQVVEFGQGGDGLVGTRPDAEWRGNVPQLMILFAQRGIGGIAASVIDAARVKELQAAVRQTVDGLWGEQTDIDLRNTLGEAVLGYTGAFFTSWNLDQRKRMQKSWGVTQDGVWGPVTQRAARDVVGGIQKALAVTVDRVVGRDGETMRAYVAFRSRMYRGPYAGPVPAPARRTTTPPPAPKPTTPKPPTKPTLTTAQKVTLIQKALRVTVDGRLGAETYQAVWCLSKVSREGIEGWAELSDDQKRWLQANLGVKVDGLASDGGPTMRAVPLAVGGVQQALGIPVDRKWTDSVEGASFGALMKSAGYKP